MGAAERSRARMFLDAHPRLWEASVGSKVWPQIKEAARIRVSEADVFIVGGDTLGDEAELFLDRLGRGARPGSDPDSRSLFLELPNDLQTLVRRELLLETPSDGGADSELD